MTWRTLAGALGIAAASLAVAAAQQPRDGRAPALGTASISGVVVTADAMAMPVRRATVEIGGKAVLTDDEGRYLVGRLPAGVYLVLANKPGFLPGAFGARRGGGPGVGVEVRAGQQVGDVRLSLVRGSVLAGTVVDQGSRPVSGAWVRAFRDGIDASTGQRLPLPVTIGLGETITDDQGRYRLYGLLPGEYIVSAAGAPAVEAVRMTTDDDVRYARQLLQAPAGIAPDSAIRRPAVALAAGRAAGMPMYFPSAESPADATRIALGVGEERQGIDVVRRPTVAGMIRGNVTGPPGTIRGGGKVHIIDTASPYAESVPWHVQDGSFVLGGIPPGRYDVVAVADAGGFRGRSEAVVQGGETALVITLQGGATVSGRLVFVTSTGQSADPTAVRLSLVGASRADLPFPMSAVRPDGRFTWTSVPAGRYRLAVTSASNIQPGWRAKSAMLGGVDLLDQVFDTTAAGADEIVVTLNDARSSISGSLQGPDGTPASDYSVIVFSADRTFWQPVSRRTQIVRPTSSGAFSLRDLPEGDYLLVALADVEPGQWHSADFLAELAPFGVKVSLADGEKKTQNIRVAR